MTPRRRQLHELHRLATHANLLSCTALPSVRIGIIPFHAGSRTMWPLEPSNIFDDTLVHVETLTAQVTVTVPGEIVTYLRAFDRLAELAVYGEDARTLITAAITALA
jgi:Domain of unknown function (DUF5753)